MRSSRNNSTRPLPWRLRGSTRWGRKGGGVEVGLGVEWEAVGSCGRWVGGRSGCVEGWVGGWLEMGG